MFRSVGLWCSLLWVLATVIPAAGAEKDDPDRTAARWIAKTEGASASIAVYGRTQSIEQGSTLPPAPFKIIGVNVQCDRGLSMAEIRNLRGLLSLTELRLWSQKGIDDGALAVISELPALQRLTFLGNRNATDAGLARLGKLENLEVLECHGTGAGLQPGGLGIQGKGLASLTKHKRLRVLNLDTAPLVDAQLECLSRFIYLEDLKLHRVTVTDRTLAYLPALKYLKSLSLGDTRTGDAGMAFVARLSALEALNFDGSYIGDAGVEHLAKMKTLRKLHFGRGNAVSDRGLITLSKLPALEELRLWKDARKKEPSVTAAGVAALAKSSSLKTIGIAGEGFSNEHLAALKTCNPERLDIHNTRITDDCWKTVAAMTRLKHLKVHGSFLTKKAADAYQADHPDVRVHATLR
jgi:hypothetical protein